MQNSQDRPVVDREPRDKMAELLRHYLAGRITGEELCCGIDEPSADADRNTIKAILDCGFEGEPCRLTDRGWLETKDGHEMRRLVLFLQSDLPYRYGGTVWLLAVGCLLGLAAAGVALAFHEHVSGRLCPRVHWFVACTIAVILLPLAGWFAVLLAFGLLNRALERRSIVEAGGDESVWPFFRRSEYEEALKHPKLLCGKSGT